MYKICAELSTSFVLIVSVPNGDQSKSNMAFGDSYLYRVSLHGLSRLTWMDTVRRCINSFPNKPWYLRVWSTSLLKTLWEKEKLLVTSNFSFSPSVFYLYGELSVIFIKLETVVCKLFQFGGYLKFFVWERVKHGSYKYIIDGLEQYYSKCLYLYSY